MASKTTKKTGEAVFRATVKPVERDSEATFKASTVRETVKDDETATLP